MSIVTCRICKQKFEKNDFEEGVDWVMPSKNWYYHKNCYDSWKGATTHEQDDEWVALIYSFLSHDLKVSYDYHLCESQRKKLVSKEKKTNKGIYFSLKYFYEVRHNDWSKGHGGIGIVSYVYNDAVAYWVKKEQKSVGLLSAIEEQIRKRSERETKVIIKKKKKRGAKARFSLENVEEGD